MLVLLLVTTRTVQSSLIPETSSAVASPPNCTLDDLDCKETKICNGYACLCSGLQLTEVPLQFPVRNLSLPLCRLDLSNNNITVIRNGSFANVSLVRWLYLQHNIIAYIESDAFVKLSQLLILNLEFNTLSWPDPTSMHPGLFRHLNVLQILNVKVNNFTSFEGFDSELGAMKNLTQLLIDGCPACSFGLGFKKLKHLYILDFAGHRRERNGPSSCQIPRVTKNLFNNLSQIRTLNMFLCNISYIEPGAFSGLNELVSLDIAYNMKLEFEGMKNATEGLCNSSLVKLSLAKIHDPYGRSTMLTAEHVLNLKCLGQLDELKLDLNRIEMFDETIFQYLPKSVEKVYLSGNRLTYGAYVDLFPNMLNLSVLDVSRLNIYNDPYYHNHYHLHYVKKREIASLWKLGGHSMPAIHLRLPKQLSKLKAQKSLLYFGIGSLNVSGPVNLTHLDVSFNLIHPWLGPVSGLQKLQNLDLSVNYCQNVSVDFFNGFRSLKYLDISNNLLGYSISKDNISGKIFRALTELEVLHISTNKITTLPSDMFNGLNRLKVINVSDNFLGGWHSRVSPCLMMLDLSNNQFTDLSEVLRHQLDVITSRKLGRCIGSYSMSNTPNVSIIMSGNPVECTCRGKSRTFWKWAFQTNVELVFSENDICTAEDSSKHKLRNREDFRQIFIHLDKSCPKEVNVILLIAGVSAGSCCLCVIVGTVVYRYRWKLRYIYHVKYRRRKRHHSQGMYTRLSSSDAFCSYASDLDRFMYDSVVPQLEEKHSLKLWVFDRDCGVGSIAENIADAIASSRKTILFVSKKFLTDKWCDYGMNFAEVEGLETKKKLIIVVLYDNIPMKLMPKNMIRFLRSYESICYPSDTQDQTTFWAHLADTVNSD